MSDKCPKCGASWSKSYESTDDAPACDVYGCLTCVWADGSFVDSTICLRNQLVQSEEKRKELKAEYDLLFNDTNAKLDEMARLAEQTRAEAHQLQKALAKANDENARLRAALEFADRGLGIAARALKEADDE